MELVRSRMGHYVVQGDGGVSRLVWDAGTFGYAANLRDIGLSADRIPEGGVVIDAGACIGDQTVLYAQLVGASGHVHACEPHPVSYQALQKNTSALTNVTCYPFALGEEAGTRTLWSSPTNIGASYVADASIEAFEPIEVLVATLDGLFGRLPRVDFIHLDAEGCEPQILRGGAALIARHKPALLLEVTEEWLKRHGSGALAFMEQVVALGYTQFLPLQENPAQFDVLAVAE